MANIRCYIHDKNIGYEIPLNLIPRIGEEIILYNQEKGVKEKYKVLNLIKVFDENEFSIEMYLI